MVQRQVLLQVQGQLALLRPTEDAELLLGLLDVDTLDIGELQSIYRAP